MAQKTLVGFVVAMEKESNLLLKSAVINQKIKLAGKILMTGSIWKTDFVLIIAGIGKVNAAMATQLLIDKFSPNTIINFGVSGGKEGSNLKAGDIVQVKNACQYDFDLSELDDVNVGYMQDYDLTYYPVNVCNQLSTIYPLVNCATGDRFTNRKSFLDIIHSLDAQIVDMECGAIAQVCYSNKCKLYVIKLISDVNGINESIYQQYANNVKTVCDKIPIAIKKVLALISLQIISDEI